MLTATTFQWKPFIQTNDKKDIQSGMNQWRSLCAIGSTKHKMPERSKQKSSNKKKDRLALQQLRDTSQENITLTSKL